MRNVARLQARLVYAVRFADVSVDASGAFRAGSTGNLIQGGLYGSGLAEDRGGLGWSDNLTAVLRFIPVEIQTARTPLNPLFCCCCVPVGLSRRRSGRVHYRTPSRRR